jgi:hypothetical protein
MNAYRRSVALVATGVVGAGLSCSTFVLADEAPSAPSGRMTFPGVKVERAPVAPAPSPATAARVYVDPSTGRARERTLEDAAAEAATPAAPAVAATPDLVHGPNGMVGVRTGTNAAVYSVVTRTDDGRLVRECVDGPAKAASGRTPASPASVARPAARTDER